MYSEEETQAIGRAAREGGIWLACHAQAAEAIKRAVRAGFRMIFHCTYADEEALDLLYARVARSAGFRHRPQGSRTHGRGVRT